MVLNNLLVECSLELRELVMLSALYSDHSDDGWGFLLMDTTNAFNLVNRAATLVLWPRCSHFLFKGYAFLLLKSSQEILLSREGVTQGTHCL